MNHSTMMLIALLFFLLIISAFFSSSETGLMSINRLKLRHQSKTSKAAKRALNLLAAPDRLLGVILLGNNFVNILAASISGFLFISWFGENLGLVLNSFIMTFIVLIFAEVSPKTVAALYPEKIALPASKVLVILLKVLYPFVWFVNTISNNFLKLFGVKFEKHAIDGFSLEELRTVVLEASAHIPNEHKEMLLGILDLEKATVENIMVPRNEVVGIDLNDGWNKILGQLASTQHTLLPVFRQDLNNFVGICHVKKALKVLTAETPLEAEFIQTLETGYFIPEGTDLTNQLIQFKLNKRRFAFVVDEYGEILGIITIQDILEEIVGKFTTNAAEETLYTPNKQNDGSILFDGSTNIKDVNEIMNAKFQAQNVNTLSGLVIETLGMIPPSGTCCLINKYPFEVLQVQDNKIKSIKIFPKLRPKETITT